LQPFHQTSRRYGIESGKAVALREFDAFFRRSTPQATHHCGSRADSSMHSMAHTTMIQYELEPFLDTLRRRNME
jgi:hypothetical protein